MRKDTEQTILGPFSDSYYPIDYAMSRREVRQMTRSCARDWRVPLALAVFIAGCLGITIAWLVSTGN